MVAGIITWLVVILILGLPAGLLGALMVKFIRLDRKFDREGAGKFISKFTDDDRMWMEKVGIGDEPDSA